MSRCLSTFVDLPAEGYCGAARRKLAGRRRIPHRLAIDRSMLREIRTETVTRMSISGVQDKLSLRLSRGKLVPTDVGGEYILKPIPSLPLPRFQSEVPANENLTMQLAEQVFGIRTAANGCIRLADGELAYLTRRFDRGRDGRKIAQEDFGQLLGRSAETAGPSYKYDASYEAICDALKLFCPAWRVEIEKLFKQIAFSYAVSNGDAHLKNFSLQQSDYGDYLLTPAYDLLCTAIHLPFETRLALSLFATGEPSGLATHGFETGGDFLELAERFEIRPARAVAVIDGFQASRDAVRRLIERSFLSEEARVDYAERYDDRLRALAVR